MLEELMKAVDNLETVARRSKADIDIIFYELYKNKNRESELAACRYAVELVARGHTSNEAAAMVAQQYKMPVIDALAMLSRHEMQHRQFEAYARAFFVRQLLKHDFKIKDIARLLDVSRSMVFYYKKLI